MTDTIEQKALALLNERYSPYRYETGDHPVRILARAIEQHEAFRQQVSDAVEKLNQHWQHYEPTKLDFHARFDRFIIAKPDPLVDAMNDSLDRLGEFERDEADRLRAAIEKRGGKIVWGEG